MDSDMEFWKYWGFEPWAFGSMRGVKRLVTFVKPALIGDIAKYYAEDTIIWQVAGDSEKEQLWGSVSPRDDFMTQRFLFIEDTEKPLRKIKSFMLGFKGYLEFHSYWPSFEDDGKVKPIKFDKRLKDLIPLVNRAIDLYLDNV